MCEEHIANNSVTLL